MPRRRTVPSQPVARRTLRVSPSMTRTTVARVSSPLALATAEVPPGPGATRTDPRLATNMAATTAIKRRVCVCAHLGSLEVGWGCCVRLE